MAESGVWRGSRAAARVAASRVSRSDRWPVQLWTWLHAQELLHGPADAAAAVEDDRQRLAARRASAC